MVKSKKGKRRPKYYAVDVWQKEFGRVSVAAIFSIFEQKFNIQKEDMKKYSFQHCVESLRLLENEDYKPNKGSIKTDI